MRASNSLFEVIEAGAAKTLLDAEPALASAKNGQEQPALWLGKARGHKAVTEF